MLRKNATIAVAILIGVCAYGRVVAQQSSRMETRVFDVSALVEPNFDAPMPVWGLPLRAAYNTPRPEHFFQSTEVMNGVAIDDIINVLRSVVAPGTWDEPPVRISNVGSRALMITQTPETLEKIAGVLQEFSESVRAAVDIEVLLVETSHATAAGFVASGGIVTGATFESLRAGREQGMRVVASAAGTSINGRRTGLIDLKTTSINGDFDVEVAQTSQIADPRMIAVRTGSMIYARPTILEDGRISVRVQADVIDDLKIQTFVTGSPSLGKIQLPSVGLLKTTASGVVGSGEAFVSGLIGPDGEQHRLLVVRASTRAKKSSSGTERFRIFDATFVTTAHATPPAINLGIGSGGALIQTTIEDGSIDAIFEREPESMDVGQVVDCVRTSVTPRKWDESGSALWVDGRSLICVGDRDQFAGIHDVLGMLTAARARFVTIGVYAVTIPRGSLANLRANQNEAWLRQVMRSADTQRRYSSVTVADLGTAVDVVAGHETAYVDDYDAEIAQGSAISDPRIETFFSGFAVRMMAFHGGSRSRFGLHFKATVSDGPREVEVFDSGAGDYGRFQQPKVQTEVMSGVTMVDDKDYCLLGESASLGNADEVMLIIAQVTAVPDAK